jgi:hypothetical protein
MKDIYNYILDNIYIFCLIIILVFVLIIFIVYLFKTDGEKEEKIEKDKTLKSKDELEKISDKEIEQRVMKEYKEETEELDEKLATLKEKYRDNSSVEAIIDNLKEAKERRTSEDLKRFEDEQEEQAIISYQQLVETVRGNEAKVENKKDTEEVKEEPVVEETAKLMEKIENLEMEIDEEPVVNKDEKVDYSYKPNEFISPVFGRMDSSNVHYREGLSYTDKIKKEEKVEEYLDEQEDYYQELNDDTPRRTRSNYDSISRTTRLDSEEFLKNLKEFRRNL